MLVEVEAEQAGQQLAGSRPPDEVGQDPAQEERREQATQDPRDAGRRLLSRVLPGADRVSEGRRGGGEWGSRAQAPGVATCRRCEWSLRVGPAGPGSVTTCLDTPRIQGPPPRPLILLQSASSRGWVNNHHWKSQGVGAVSWLCFSLNTMTSFFSVFMM